MFLVQLLLPAFGNDGARFPAEEFARVHRELTERFGGVTAYLRSPASGEWKRDDGRLERDEMLMVEAMTPALDRPWWEAYRRELERRFRQEFIVVRAWPIEGL